MIRAVPGLKRDTTQHNATRHERTRNEQQRKRDLINNKLSVTHA